MSVLSRKRAISNFTKDRTDYKSKVLIVSREEDSEDEPIEHVVEQKLAPLVNAIDWPLTQATKLSVLLDQAQHRVTSLSAVDEQKRQMVQSEIRDAQAIVADMINRSLKRLHEREPPIVERDDEIQMFVKNLTGATRTLSVRRLAKVEELKAKVMEKEGIPVNEMRLVFGGKQLEDGKLIYDYGVSYESTVHLLLRLR